MTKTKIDNSGSKVSERLAWLEGQRCSVRISYAEIGQLGGECFTGIYRDVVPLGREYFFAFEVAGRHRLIRTTSVVEVTQLGEADHG